MIPTAFIPVLSNPHGRTVGARPAHSFVRHPTEERRKKRLIGNENGGSGERVVREVVTRASGKMWMRRARGAGVARAARASKIARGGKLRGEWHIRQTRLTFSDTGIKLILRDLHSKIRILEQELTEMHHKMALDPEAGISVLLDRPANPYSREIRATDNDAAAWMDLIGKHKE
jgi:hypothetical protein